MGCKGVLKDAKAGAAAVRFALVRAVESLEDVVRVAVSRGGRAPTQGAATSRPPAATHGCHVRTRMNGSSSR
ncbi:hypothetical protein SCYAM73S_08285 [Streptomyces cyaneofuscatus]